MLTVYGIETSVAPAVIGMIIDSVATVLTVYGIETSVAPAVIGMIIDSVATVLTVYGIETFCFIRYIFHTICSCNSAYRLRY